MTRLAPIDRPKGLLPRLAFAMTARRLGKVIAPMRIVYARFPELFRVAWTFLRIEDRSLPLDPELRHLVKVFTAQLNGCGFCRDIGRAMAVYDASGLEKLDLLDEWRTHPAFTASERAALAFAEASTRDLHVKDAVWEEVRRYFSEREIVEIAWLVALENYYNRLAIPFGIEDDGLCEIAAAKLATRSPSASR